MDAETTENGKVVLPPKAEEVLMDPAAALRLVKRLRRTRFYLRMEVSMPSGPDRHYPYYTSMQVTVAQLEKLLTDMARFHEAKGKREEALPMVRVCLERERELRRYESRLCWIG